MSERWFRAFALVIGLLGIPSVFLQVLRAWPPVGHQLSFLAMQAIVLAVFVVYGFGWAYCKPRSTSTDVQLQSDKDV